MPDETRAGRSVRLALGLQSHARLHRDQGRQLVEFARAAEGAGLDGVLIGDHVLIGAHLERYPYPPVHFSEDDPWLEPLVVLAAAAAVTSKIVLATGVLVSPLRPAALLAKTAASVDAISGGRLELGVGVGWQPEEFSAVGCDFARRGDLLTDGIRACQALWRSGPAAYTGSTVAFEDIWCSPRPSRPSGIPVLFSGSLHERNLSRIVELGTGWITHPGLPIDDIAEGAHLLEERWVAAGRSQHEVQVRTRLPIALRSDGSLDVEAIASTVRNYAAAGVTDLTVWSNTLTRSPDEILSCIDELGRVWQAICPISSVDS